jgi:uncharacterized protein (TIRG00374 family)
LGLLVSALFIGLFLWGIDLRKAWDALLDANYGIALLSLPVYLVAVWFRTIRWQVLLRPLGEFRGVRLFPLVIIGFMTNNLIPARIGELVRAYLLGEREGTSKAAALGTIAVDRLFDGLTLVLMLAIVGAVAGVNDVLRATAIVSAAVFGAALVVMLAVASSETRARTLVGLVLRRLPERLRAPADALVERFLVGLRSLRSPSDMALVALWSTVSWLLEATMYYMIGLAFHLGLGFHIYLLITAAANLAISIIPTSGGVGPFEVVTKETVVFFGARESSAVAYAAALHALLLFPVILLGLYFLWAINISLSDLLRRPAREPAAEAPDAGAVPTGKGDPG